MTVNKWLLAGGMLSAIAAILHLACIFGGPTWYRLFDAGERIAHMAERGSPLPATYALLIALVLSLWSAYALAGAELIPHPPLLRTGLITIAATYILRAAALPLMLVWMPDRGVTFLVVSSAIIGLYGAVRAIGIATGWARLG